MDRFVGVYKRRRVVIIGAGVSGIAAAARLIAAGFKNDEIVILEASNRVGGRIYTTAFGGYTLEIGAQWVHGEDGNIVYEMAKQDDLLDDSATDFINVQCVLSDRTLVNPELTSKLFIKSAEIRDNISNSEKGCFHSYFVPRYNEFVNQQMPDLPKNVKNGFLEWLHQFQNSVEGSDSWYHTSVTTLDHYLECEGNSLIRWKKGGYENVIQLICKKYGVDKCKLLDTVELNKIVVGINWNGSHILPEKFLREPYNIVVNCADGTSYVANHAIVTIGLGVLKQQYSKLFHPNLPKHKIKVIKGLGFGTVDKIFVKFPHKWWPEDCLGFSLLWTEHDLKNTEFIKGDNSWIKDIFGFYLVDGADKVLCGWVVGESARIMEQQSDERMLEICYRLLNKFLGGHYTIPKPESVLRSKWHSEPYVQGSYSFRSINSDILNVSHGQLADPLVNDAGCPVVFFAGEAAHPHFYSTVHGAIETGICQAENVISACQSTRWPFRPLSGHLQLHRLYERRHRYLEPLHIQTV